MALPPEGLTRGLALVRYLYDLALQQSRQSGLRRATAILTFHDAVEMFLVLGLQHHDPYNDKKLYQFHEYWKELALKDVHLTQQGAMASFSRIRANFKHHAILPSSTAIEDARVHVRDFLTENIPIVFGANFEDISLASTISFFERTRTFLEQAEKLMAEGKYDGALGKIAFAFALLLGDYDASRRSHRLSNHVLIDLDHLDMTNRGGPSLPRLIADRLRDFGRNVRERIDAIENSLKLVSLGIDYERFQRAIWGVYEIGASPHRAADTFPSAQSLLVRACGEIQMIRVRTVPR